MSAEPDGVPGFAATADRLVPELPDKPSIAVLPFVNLSGDPEQVYFSDGISEDIITALSKISNLTVASRSSTFGYRDGAVDTRTVCREQGVRFVLEGSVRKSANRVRVTAQLTDGSTGHSVWAERYDRDLDDIFAVQDELMREIVVALDVELREGEQLRFWSSGTHSVEAWECVRISAPVILNTRFAELDLAKKRLDRALELDPEYAIAWVMLGWYHQCFVDVAGGFRSPEVVSSSLENMQRCAQKAIELAEYCADAYSVLALYHLEKREYDLAKENADKSVELAPGNAENMIEATAVFNKAGDPRRGMELTQRAMEVCPLYRPGFLRALGTANRFLGKPEAAADIYREAVKRQPELLSGQANLASVLGELGRLEEALSVAQTIRGMYPGFSVDNYMAGLAYKNPDDLKRFRDGLIAAGLPE